MSLKIRKGVPLIDQHDKNYMYGGKFGGNYIPETLKKPIDDLTQLFSKLRKDKKFIKISKTNNSNVATQITNLFDKLSLSSENATDVVRKTPSLYIHAL